MPTTRPRYTLTETDELQAALDRAALLWPELDGDRPALLRQLVLRGSELVAAGADERRARRLTAIRETSGVLPGVYPANAARLLNAEWPE